MSIHSTEEADGVRFFTMELVEGQTLDAVVPAGGLPLARFVELAMQMADALTAAHQKGITHHDLKPCNVIVGANGRVKVLDFGLSRVADGRAVASQSRRFHGFDPRLVAVGSADHET